MATVRWNNVPSVAKGLIIEVVLSLSLDFVRSPCIAEAGGIVIIRPEGCTGVQCPPSHICEYSHVSVS